MIFCIDPQNASQIWPHASNFIRDAYEAGGDDTFETTEADVLHGDALLWVFTDGKSIKAACVTKLWQSPRKKICQILAGSGSLGLSNCRAWLRQIEQYAIDESCNVVRLSGRRGWSRAFKDYHEPFITLEKQLCRD